MTSPADRFTRLEKLAIFLIALGQERTREILADVDVDTLQHLNEAMAGLGDVSVEEKAAVMLEFAHFFYEDEPLTGKVEPSTAPKKGPPKKAGGPPSAATKPPAGKPPLVPKPGRAPSAGRGGATGRRQERKTEPAAFDLSSSKPSLSDEEQAILQTLDKLKRNVDPGQIDWGRAGYDFGEGFKGPDDSRR